MTVTTNITVEKVLFSESGPTRVTGVLVSASRAGPQYAVVAGKEVILCAGVFGTPHLLLLSGVGPKSELEALDVKCVQDSPHVGKHLLDVSS